MGKHNGKKKKKSRQAEGGSADSNKVDYSMLSRPRDENAMRSDDDEQVGPACVAGDLDGWGGDVDGTELDRSGRDSEDKGEAGESVVEFEEEVEPAKKKKKKKKKVRRLSMTETESFNAKLRRRGVLFVSRIPPRMGPAKIKSLLSDFGAVTRVYLVEEDKSARKRRRRLAGGGGGGGKRYVEGWIEFEDKHVAERVGRALNNTPISNHKRSAHYGDLWNVKYLRKFRWEHLTEKVAYERRVREQKLRVEMMEARRENAAYANLVEAGKTMDRIEERRRKRREREEGIVDSGNRTKEGKRRMVEGENRTKRKFQQTSPVEEKSGVAAKRAVLGSLV